MNPMRTVSAAVLLAATLIVPVAYAATMDSAKITMAVKADAQPVGSVVDIIGKWDAANLATLSSAGSVKTFDTKSLYPAADQVKIAGAETSNSAALGKLRDALRADTGLNKWFSANNIDINRVIAVGGPASAPHVYLY